MRKQRKKKLTRVITQDRNGAIYEEYKIIGENVCPKKRKC